MATLEARFWAKVDRSGGPDACWLWQGARSTNGYGQFCIGQYPGGGNIMRHAHRVAYALVHGPIGPGKSILHKCDNQLCVNPAHLRPGTHRENMRDMVAKGRSSRGSANFLSKLTERDMRAMLRLYRGVVACGLLADAYGVTTKNVYAIVSRQTWRHVDPDAIIGPDPGSVPENVRRRHPGRRRQQGAA